MLHSESSLTVSSNQMAKQHLTHDLSADAHGHAPHSLWVWPWLSFRRCQSHWHVALQSKESFLCNYNQMALEASLSVPESSPKAGFLRMCVIVNKLPVTMLPKGNLSCIWDKFARASYQESPIQETELGNLIQWIRKVKSKPKNKKLKKSATFFHSRLLCNI